MLGHLFLILSSVHVGSYLGILLEEGIHRLRQTSRRVLKKRVKICPGIGGEDRISALSDDLLVKILLLIPTKDAVSTMILSKRWQSVWTMVPELVYHDINDGARQLVIGGLIGGLLGRLFGKTNQQQQRMFWFIDKSLECHKAPILEKLAIELGTQCPVDDVNVGNWIENAVYRRVHTLGFRVTWSTEPTSLPGSLYTCDTLVSLSLSNKILVDVPSPACLPNLKGLGLYSVVYKDEDSIVRLLSSCPILQRLIVIRCHQDNVKIFNIKVSSLKCLSYEYVKLGASHYEGIGGTLVIDSPALKKIFITDYSRDDILLTGNKHRLDKARINFCCYPDNMFMRSLSSVMYLELILSFETLAWFNAINFPRLMECKILLLNELDWLEPLMILLQKSPNLKLLFIDKTFIQLEEESPLSWNQLSFVPGCLSTHLEIFEWKGYGGRREENEIVRYIFANSKCLKRAGISFTSTCFFKGRKEKELKSMSRVSASSQLLFSTRVKYMSF